MDEQHEPARQTIKCQVSGRAFSSVISRHRQSTRRTALIEGVKRNIMLVIFQGGFGIKCVNEKKRFDIRQPREYRVVLHCATRNDTEQRSVSCEYTVHYRGWRVKFDAGVEHWAERKEVTKRHESYRRKYVRCTQPTSSNSFAIHFYHP